MRRVTLLVGAPCSGKTTYVREHAQPGDLIVDWDVLAMDAGSPVAHDHPAEFRAAATSERKRLEQHIASTPDVTAWVIRTLPSPADRDDAVRRLGGTDLVVIDPGMPVCLMRASSAGRPATVDAVIVKWFAIAAGARNYTTTSDKDRRGDPRRTSEWRRVRDIVRQRTTACGICGRPIEWGKRFPHPLSFSVDHIVPLKNGGAPYDLSNLVGVHNRCNSSKGASTDVVTHRTSRAW